MVWRFAGGKGNKGGKGKHKQWQPNGKGFQGNGNYDANGPYDKHPNPQQSGKNWFRESQPGGKNGFAGGKHGNQNGKGWNSGGKNGNSGGKGWKSGGNTWR